MQSLKNKRGQGLVEYILVVFLMAIAAITWLHNLRDRTQAGFNNASKNLQTEFGN
jgi:hypothetical protein